MRPRKHENTKKTKYLLFFVSLVSFVVAPQAQQPSQPIFRTGTRLIVETVTVKDKDGKAVEGLAAKDFTVTEDGEAQTISFVEYQRVDTPAAAPAPAPAAPAPAAAAAPPAPDEHDGLHRLQLQGERVPGQARAPGVRPRDQQARHRGGALRRDRTGGHAVPAAGALGLQPRAEGLRVQPESGPGNAPRRRPAARPVGHHVGGRQEGAARLLVHVALASVLPQPQGDRRGDGRRSRQGRHQDPAADDRVGGVPGQAEERADAALHARLDRRQRRSR